MVFAELRKGCGKNIGDRRGVGVKQESSFGFYNLRMSVIYPSRHIKEAIGSKNFQLGREVSARFIN